MANPAPLNSPFPDNDAATPLYTGGASQFTYSVPALPDGTYTLVADITNDETVPQQTRIPYSLSTVGGDTGGFTDLFDGVGWLLEAALVADASDNNPVWTDLTTRCRALSFTRGRQRELERWEPGTLTATLDNRDRALDPNVNQLVAPMRRVRLSAQFGGISYPLWYGFADSWPQAWQLPSDAYVQLTATDAFKVFANATVLPSAWHTTILAASPVGYYRLNEKAGSVAADSSGARNDGSYPQAATTSRSTAGLVAFDDDAAIAFDGSQDTVIIPTAAQPTDYPFTIEGWFSTTDSTAPIWYQSTGHGDYYAYIYVFAGVVLAAVNAPTSDIYTRFGSGGVISSQSATSVYADGNPHHFLVRFTAHNVAPRIYMDAVDVTSATSVTNVAEVPYGQALIGYEKHNGAHCTGTIDEIAIYNYDVGATAAAVHFAAATKPWEGDTAGQRFNRILDVMDWPAADREYIVNTPPGGNTIVAVQDLRGKTGLDALDQLSNSEFGTVVMNSSGQVRFRERHAIYTQDRYRNPRFVFGDDGTNTSELPWNTLVLGSSDELIRNDVQVTTTSNLVAQVEDASSISRNLRFTYALADLLLTTTSDAYGLAYWVLNHYSDPFQRVDQIQLSARHPKNANDIWVAALSLDVEDRITVIRRPPGGGLPIQQDAHIEHIDVAIDPQGQWDVTYQLSPAEDVNVALYDDPSALYDSCFLAF